MIKRRIAFCFLPAVLFLACTRDFSIVSPPQQKRDLRPLEKQVLSASDEFGIRLFKEVAKSETGKNVFISPFSISSALGMTLNGAAGQTETDMKSALGFSGMAQTDINEAYQSLIKSLLQADPKVVFDAAHSIWVRLGFDPEPLFIKTNQTYFDALVRSLDFNLPSAPDTINAWIEKNTGGKIRNMVKQIKPTDIMFLINAIYFKGIWTVQFDPKQTRDEAFFLGNGSTVTCPMMRQRDSLRYASAADFQAVEIQYGGGAFSMLIFLPSMDKTADTFIQDMTPEKWESWMERFKETTVNLILPRFKTESDLQLNEPLKRMGMAIAFSTDADFTRIHRAGNLFIDRVLHKTFVEVNEEGTEAAAATVVVIGRTSIGGPEEIILFVNRPFVFAIREKETGAILFIGKIEDPS